ncbi:MAG: hypothetical protein ACXVCY_04320 [Pseudobdellovibrionaceae bacterium]
MSGTQNSNKLVTTQNVLPAGISFADVMQALALGLAPKAPRLAENAMASSSLYGGYAKGLGQRGSISFTELRQVAETSPLLSAIISTRQHQRARYCRVAQRANKGEVGFRVVHEREHDPKFKVPEGFKELCRQVEKMLMSPWVMKDENDVPFRDIEPNLSGFASKIMHDSLVINRPVIELGLDPYRRPVSFGAIDGANVIPTFKALKYLASINKDLPKDFMENYNGFKSGLQKLADKYGIDLDESTEYIYIENGRPTAAFRHDELIVAPIFPTSNTRETGYPKSLLERSLGIIIPEIMAMQGNARFFEFGSMAEVILTLKGNFGDDHVKKLEQILQANMSGMNGMYRVPLIATPNGRDDLDVVPIKTNHKDMLFDVYIQKLTNLACAVFRMHPSEINEAARAGDNTGSLSQANQNLQIDMAQEQGLETLLLHEKQSIFDPILKRIDPNLCLEWEFGKTESQQLELVSKYASITTIDERRGMMGLDPLGPEKGGDVIDNSFVQAAIQAKQQAEQQEEQQQQQMPNAKGPQEPNENEDDEETEDKVDDEENGEPNDDDVLRHAAEASRKTSRNG